MAWPPLPTMEEKLDTNLKERLMRSLKHGAPVELEQERARVYASRWYLPLQEHAPWLCCWIFFLGFYCSKKGPQNTDLIQTEPVKEWSQDGEECDGVGKVSFQKKTEQLELKNMGVSPNPRCPSSFSPRCETWRLGCKSKSSDIVSTTFTEESASRDVVKKE